MHWLKQHSLTPKASLETETNFATATTIQTAASVDKRLSHGTLVVGTTQISAAPGRHSTREVEDVEHDE